MERERGHWSMSADITATAKEGSAEPKEHILQFFAYSHLHCQLQLISKPFCDLAHAIVMGNNCAESGNVTFGSPLPRNPERTVALRKLLEAKDAAVRAFLAK
jgi:hypothetical protein